MSLAWRGTTAITMDDDAKRIRIFKRERGPVVAPDPGKIRITIRLDADVIDWFREQVTAAGGGNYQSLINKALREYTNSHRIA